MLFMLFSLFVVYLSGVLLLFLASFASAGESVSIWEIVFWPVVLLMQRFK